MGLLTERGLCGLDLWVQCFTIAAIQTASSLTLLAVSVARMVRPESFIDDWEILSRDPHLKNAALNENDELAVELMVAAGASFIASFLLIVGLRKKSTTLIYPWIIITLAQLIGGMIIFAVRLRFRGRSLSPEDDGEDKPGVSWAKLVAVTAYHLLVVFFLHSVTSYYAVLKRWKRAQRRAVSLELSSGYPSSEMITFSRTGLDLMEEGEDSGGEEQQQQQQQHQQQQQQQQQQQLQLHQQQQPPQVIVTSA